MTDIAQELGLTKDEPKKPGRKPAVTKKAQALGADEPNRFEAARVAGRGNRLEGDREPERTARRVPFHEQRMVLDANVPDGYVGRWFNGSKPGRIDEARLAGYAFVNKSGKVFSDVEVTGNSLDSRVSKPGGGGVTLYLMVIRKELYEADQLAKRKLTRERTDAVLAEQENDPAFYARDERGNQRHASHAQQVTINEQYL